MYCLITNRLLAFLPFLFHRQNQSYIESIARNILVQEVMSQNQSEFIDETIHADSIVIGGKQRNAENRLGVVILLTIFSLICCRNLYSYNFTLTLIFVILKM